MKESLLVLCYGCFAIGVLLLVVSKVWMIIAAFQENAGWGVACALAPIASIAFAIVHWNRAYLPAMVFLCGLGSIAVGIALAAASGR